MVDETGTLIALLRQDAAVPLRADAALLKAQTAVRVHAPTAALSELYLALKAPFCWGAFPYCLPMGYYVARWGFPAAILPMYSACAERAVRCALTARRRPHSYA